MRRLRAICLMLPALAWALLPGPAPAEDDVAPMPRGIAVTAAQMQVAPRLVVPRPRPAGLVPGLAPDRSPRPPLREAWDMPALRWDGHPRGPRWTAAVMGALRGHGAPLLDTVPQDIAAWCPAYPTADRGQRAAFWAGLISALAWHESTHEADAVGGGGQWFGLVQIAPGTARYRGCEAQSGAALLDGAANLRCGVRIMAATVPRDRVVAEGLRGVAADWGPFHSDRKREDMRRWVRAQDYCQPRTRPALRPPGLMAAARPAPRPGAAPPLLMALGLPQ